VLTMLEQIMYSVLLYGGHHELPDMQHASKEIRERSAWITEVPLPYLQENLS
jgi:hypothetical protein